MRVTNITNSRLGLKYTSFKAKAPETKQNNRLKSNEHKRELAGLMAAAAIMAGTLGLSGCSPKQDFLDDEITIITEAQKAQLEENKKQEETYLQAREVLNTAANDLEYIHSEIWGDFKQFYGIFKECKGKYENDETEGYEPVLDLEHYFSRSLTAQIAAGETTPWKNIQTAKEANNLIEDVLDSTINAANLYHEEIDSTTGVNEGEFGVILKTIEEVAKINPETNAIAQVYLEELNRSVKERLQEQEGLDKRFQDDDELTQSIRKNAEYFCYLGEAAQGSKARYERLKDEYSKKDSHTLDETMELYDALNGFYTNTYWILMMCPDFNPIEKNPNIVLSDDDIKTVKLNSAMRIMNDIIQE